SAPGLLLYQDIPTMRRPCAAAAYFSRKVRVRAGSATRVGFLGNAANDGRSQRPSSDTDAWKLTLALRAGSTGPSPIGIILISGNAFRNSGTSRGTHTSTTSAPS